MTTIKQREQIKKAFVSDTKNIGDYVYNNQDWYQEDAQRMRYILATINTVSYTHLTLPTIYSV